MPPVYKTNTPLTLTVEFYVAHNPGNENHLRELARSYLEGKGIKTKQEWDGDKPTHPVVIVV